MKIYKLKPFDERTVIVLDTGNYKESYSEPTPFKATVKDIYDNEIWVVSLATGKEYELYYYQVLETMDIEEIKYMLSGGEYGGFEDSKLIKKGEFFK